MPHETDPYALSETRPDEFTERLHPGSAAAYDIVRKNDVSVVVLRDENIVDAVQIEELGKKLEQEFRSQSTPRIVIDLERVEHLSSAAIGMFLKLRNWATERGGGFGLCCVNDHLNQIFSVTKLNKTLTLHKDRSSAVESLTTAG